LQNTLVLTFVLVMGASAGARTLETDVVVVGGGAAGLPAAIEAAETGAKVILLEKMPFLGGSAVRSGGIVFGAGTSVQKKAGIKDNADALYEYCMTLNGWQLDPALLRVYCDRSAEAIEWLLELGSPLLPENLYVAGIESVPRGHLAQGGGPALMKPVIDRAGSHPNITVMLETTGLRLIQKEGKVSGIVASTKDGQELKIMAPAVILATGGYLYNEEMMRRYRPEVMAYGSRVINVAGLGSTGDGITMAVKVGAGTIGLDSAGTGLMTPAFAQTKVMVGTPPWLIYVNKDGQRFVNERAPYNVMGGICMAQPDGLVWAVFDDAAPEPDGWTKEEINGYVREGLVAKADTLEELAVEIGISPRGLVNTVKGYNADVARGKDAAFFKDPAGLVQIARGPFYAVQLCPTLGLSTRGGLRISTGAEVLTPYGEPIPGLYAAGETTGGLVGGKYPGSGTLICSSIVFGRIAGKNAAGLAGK
jgi:fumarate reductase flavoprotein subunit